MFSAFKIGNSRLSLQTNFFTLTCNCAAFCTGKSETDPFFPLHQAAILISKLSPHTCQQTACALGWQLCRLWHCCYKLPRLVERPDIKQHCAWANIITVPGPEQSDLWLAQNAGRTNFSLPDSLRKCTIPYQKILLCLRVSFVLAIPFPLCMLGLFALKLSSSSNLWIFSIQVWLNSETLDFSDI